MRKARASIWYSSLMVAQIACLFLRRELPLMAVSFRLIALSFHLDRDLDLLRRRKSLQVSLPRMPILARLLISRQPFRTNHRSRNCWVPAPAWPASLAKDIIDGDVIDVDSSKLQ